MRSLAIRSAAAASALPSPSPAATGMRLWIVTASGGSSPQARERNSASARPARLSPGIALHSMLSLPDSFGAAEISSARSIEATSEQIG